MKIKNFKIKNHFTAAEIILWCVSVLAVLVSACATGEGGTLSAIASVIGVTSLILNAKGNPIGQGLMIIFGTMYGIISFDFAYYGEMITYLGMTVPMAILALISWLKNPYGDKKSQVRVGKIGKNEIIFMWILTVIVTAAFYFILDIMGTSNLIPSTLSVATSFLAAYLTFRRSPYFALAYAANDVVLIILWILAAITDSSYTSVIVCFVVFLVNDIYGFISWRRMEKEQSTK